MEAIKNFIPKLFPDETAIMNLSLPVVLHIFL
jgi:hypothetical protein